MYSRLKLFSVRTLTSRVGALLKYPKSHADRSCQRLVGMKSAGYIPESTPRSIFTVRQKSNSGPRGERNAGMPFYWLIFAPMDPCKLQYFRVESSMSPQSDIRRLFRPLKARARATRYSTSQQTLRSAVIARDCGVLLMYTLRSTYVTTTPTYANDNIKSLHGIDESSTRGEKPGKRKDKENQSTPYGIHTTATCSQSRESKGPEI